MLLLVDHAHRARRLGQYADLDLAPVLGVVPHVLVAVGVLLANDHVVEDRDRMPGVGGQPQRVAPFRLPGDLDRLVDVSHDPRNVQHLPDEIYEIDLLDRLPHEDT